MKNKLLYAVLCVSALTMAGCSSGTEQENKNATKEVQPGQAPAAAEQEQQANPEQIEEVTVRALGNTMSEIRYDQKTITVPANTRVRVTLINESSDPAMLHNIVFTDKGKFKLAALAGQKAGPEGDYVPKSPIIIAYSPMAKPGQTLTFEFNAPPPGEYDFVCTFPGHYMQMNGTFIVK